MSLNQISLNIPNVKTWLDEHTEVYGHKIDPQELINSAEVINSLLIKANKRVNVISLYFAWKGILEESIFFSQYDSKGMEDRDFSKLNFEQTVKDYLEVKQQITDVNLFIKTCAYLDLSLKSQGKNISVVSPEEADGSVSVIKIDSIEWSAEIIKKLSKATEIKPTEFNSIVMSFKHLVTKFQLLQLAPRLDELLRMRIYTHTSLSKELGIKAYNLNKLIEMTIEMGKYTAEEINDFFNINGSNTVTKASKTGKDSEDDEERIPLSKANAEFITALANEHYRGNKYLALSKVVSSMRALTESQFVSKVMDGEDIRFVRNDNVGLLDRLNQQNQEGDDD